MKTKTIEVVIWKKLKRKNSINKWLQIEEIRNVLHFTFFFLAHWTCANFFGHWTKYAGFFSYLYALPGYTQCTFFSKSNNPLSHHFACLRNGPPDKSWNFPYLIFPLSCSMYMYSFVIIIFQVRCMFFA